MTYAGCSSRPGRDRANGAQLGVGQRPGGQRGPLGDHGRVVEQDRGDVRRGQPGRRRPRS